MIKQAPLWCLFFVVQFGYKKNIFLVKDVKLEKNKSYVFASNHSFFFDGPAVIATVDRNCYSLFGATEQLYLNFSRR